MNIEIGNRCSCIMAVCIDNTCIYISMCAGKSECMCVPGVVARAYPGQQRNTVIWCNHIKSQGYLAKRLINNTKTTFRIAFRHNWHGCLDKIQTLSLYCATNAMNSINCKLSMSWWWPCHTPRIVQRWTKASPATDTCTYRNECMHSHIHMYRHEWKHMHGYHLYLLHVRNF